MLPKLPLNFPNNSPKCRFINRFALLRSICLTSIGRENKMTEFDSKKKLKEAKIDYTWYNQQIEQKLPLLYKFLGICYKLDVYGDDNLIKNECAKWGMTFADKHKSRTIFRLATQWYNVEDKTFLNARIATYVRALERFKADKITPEEVYEKLEEYDIDYWANPRDKFRENNEIKKKSSARRWNPTIKFTNVFEKSDMADKDFVALKCGENILISADAIVLGVVESLKEKFDNIDSAFKTVVEQRNKEAENDKN